MIEVPTYLVVAVVSGYLCYLFVPLVKKYCLEKNLYDMPGPRKIHETPMPRLGGVAIYAAYFLGLLPGLLLLPVIWHNYYWHIIGIFLGGTVIFIMGVVDDLKELRPTSKLLWEVIAALIVILFGVRLEILNIPFFKLITLGFWGIPLTLLWLVAMTNTINLIDGLDGLAAGVSIIAAVSFLVLSIIMNLPLPSLLAAGVIGAALAFLKFNYFPASIFMGDSGALFLGYIFGVISLFWPKSFATVVMFVPILALGVPIIEVITTFFRRLFAGQKIYIADQRHIFHFLLDLGIPQRITVWMFYLVSFQFALAAFAIAGGNRNILFVLQSAFVIFIAIIISRKIKLGRADKK
jgi:UDP-GlcNAc:undecaprenyl-phosphate GlcNAc-1-phosphate transferase